MSEGKPKLFLCVTCGNPISELWRKYSPTVLKLVLCDSCGETADKYVEYDPVIIFTDVVLFNRQAYRHALFNSSYKNHWKLGLLILLLKSYDEYAYRKEQDDVSSSFYTESLYYFSCFMALLGQLIFIICITTMIMLHWKLIPASKPTNCTIMTILKCLIVSSFGDTLLLSSLIWSDTRMQINVLLIFFYTYISQVQSLSVVCTTSRVRIALMLAVAHAIVHICFTIL